MEAYALRQAEAGTAAGEIGHVVGVVEATFYRWKKVYAGIGASEIHSLKQLEGENAEPPIAASSQRPGRDQDRMPPWNRRLTATCVAWFPGRGSSNCDD